MMISYRVIAKHLIQKGFRKDDAKTTGQAALYECLHCKNEGICRSCDGFGKADTLTERIGNRIPPVLAIFTIAGLLLIVIDAAATHNPHTNQLIAFSSGIIGTILGFYFYGKTLK